MASAIGKSLARSSVKLERFARGCKLTAQLLLSRSALQGRGQLDLVRRTKLGIVTFLPYVLLYHGPSIWKAALLRWMPNLTPAGFEELEHLLFRARGLEKRQIKTQAKLQHYLSRSFPPAYTHILESKSQECLKALNGVVGKGLNPLLVDAGYLMRVRLARFVGLAFPWILPRLRVWSWLSFVMHDNQCLRKSGLGLTGNEVALALLDRGIVPERGSHYPILPSLTLLKQWIDFTAHLETVPEAESFLIALVSGAKNMRSPNTAQQVILQRKVFTPL